MTAADLLLGIDVGTTKAAAVVVDAAGKLLGSASRAHEADLEAPAGHAEQDVGRLLEASWAVVRELPAGLRQRVGAAGVAGQMHGVVVLDAAGEPLTPLVTWEDRRCLEEGFTDGLNRRLRTPLRTGFGCATLAWYAATGRLPAAAAASCTIHDLVVARLCGLTRPVTDTTGAAGWGCFDPETLRWDREAARCAGVPESLLPEVLPCGARAGAVTVETARSLGLVAGIPVAAALGDNQASVFATLDDPETELALNIGTGGQLSAVMAAGEGVAVPEGRFDVRPFPGGRRMVVAPLLAGGSAWAWLAETVESWLRALGLTPPTRDEIYRRLNDLGLDARGELTVRPHFLGERWDATLRASIEDITPRNFTLGNVASALARGLMVSLKEMMPGEVLAGRRGIVGSGNALRRNPLLQHMAAKVFDLPLRLAEGREEAARGAARCAAGLVPPHA